MTQITEGQRKKLLLFFRQAANKALLEAGADKESLQRLLERSREFQGYLTNGIRDLSMSNRFAEEESLQSITSTSPGHELKSVAEQVARLRELFPELRHANERLAEQPLPRYAEGWFAIPNWRVLAPTYGQAVSKVINVLSREICGDYDENDEDGRRFYSIAKLDDYLDVLVRI